MERVALDLDEAEPVVTAVEGGSQEFALLQAASASETDGSEDDLTEEPDEEPKEQQVVE